MSISVMPPGVSATGVDAARVRFPDTVAVRVGGYAHAEVEIESAGRRGEPIELSLAAPFGALFAALFQARPLLVRSLSLTYVSLQQLGRLPTFSVKLTELGEGGEARLSLLVFHGASVCVRGEAVVALGQVNAEPHS